MQEKKPLVKIDGEKITFTKEEIELIHNTVARGASNEELKLFIAVCQRKNLDPFTNQIHFVRRGDRGVIQTGIDGYRAIASRSGEYAGNDDPIFDNDKKPTKATVSVYKIIDGIKCAFTATARWSEYAPSGTMSFMWNKMPFLMLGKVAEALALRKAFPEDLSGIYTDEEMHQADPTGSEKKNAPAPKNGKNINGKLEILQSHIQNATTSTQLSNVANEIEKIKNDLGQDGIQMLRHIYKGQLERVRRHHKE